MIGIPGRKKTTDEKIDDIETRAFALKNAVEGKEVFFFGHNRGSNYGFNYKAYIVVDNEIRDITSLFKGISAMLEVNHHDMIEASSSGIGDALENLSLIVYGKKNGFRYRYVRGN